MNVEIGAEAAQFPEKEYINGIAVAVYQLLYLNMKLSSGKLSHFSNISLKERQITEEPMKVKIWKKLLIHKHLV